MFFEKLTEKELEYVVKGLLTLMVEDNNKVNKLWKDGKDSFRVYGDESVCFVARWYEEEYACRITDFEATITMMSPKRSMIHNNTAYQSRMCEKFGRKYLNALEAYLKESLDSEYNSKTKNIEARHAAELAELQKRHTAELDELRTMYEDSKRGLKRFLGIVAKASKLDGTKKV